VVDAEGKLLGMVTEGDLIRRLAAGAETHRGWFSRLFASASMDAARFARAEGRRARDVMTTDLATVDEDASAPARSAWWTGRGSDARRLRAEQLTRELALGRTKRSG